VLTSLCCRNSDSEFIWQFSICSVSENLPRMGSFCKPSIMRSGSRDWGILGGGSRGYVMERWRVRPQSSVIGPTRISLHDFPVPDPRRPSRKPARVLSWVPSRAIGQMRSAISLNNLTVDRYLVSSWGQRHCMSEQLRDERPCTGMWEEQYTNVSVVEVCCWN